jgi:hypothetical protein
MALPDDIRLVEGTPFVWGEVGATVMGLSVTKALAVDALASDAAQQGVYADLADGNSRLPIWLLVYIAVETGSAPNANTSVAAYLGFARDTTNFPGGMTGANGSYTIADRVQLGVPANIFVATATGNLTRTQQPSWIRVKGRYVAPMMHNQMNVAIRDETTASDNGSGIVVVPYFEVIAD